MFPDYNLVFPTQASASPPEFFGKGLANQVRACRDGTAFPKTRIWGGLGTLMQGPKQLSIMESQMEKQAENNMETCEGLGVLPQQWRIKW